MVEILRDCLSSKLVVNLVLLGLAGGLFTVAKKLKA